MNVKALLSETASSSTANRAYEYPVTSTPYHGGGALMTPKSLSPNNECKNVHFRFGNSDPKTLHIYPHDTTDSITTTVKNMFGIKMQDESGLSFQDPDGRYMILRHENFSDDMMVDIRVEDNQYNIRHTLPMFFGGPPLRGSFSDARSVSPSASRGRRSASAGGRSKSMKRQASLREEDYYNERYLQGPYHQQPPQQFLPEGDDESESRSRIEPVASAEISLDNIVEGSRRKRPKFSSDELPLFPPPALPRQDGSTASSVGPSHPVPQATTPYGVRTFNYPHPTPPSTYGFSTAAHNGATQTDVYGQPRTIGSTIPTPAPTVASCISDEDVALQLMRLGEVPNGSGTASTLEDNTRAGDEDAFSSECGEYGDEGRSDTTDLPELPPLNNTQGRSPGIPITYSKNHQKYKSLDEILPSFDSTEPSEDECSPMDPGIPQRQPPQQQYRREAQPLQRHRQELQFQEPQHAATDEEDYDDHFDDEADETYIGKDEDEEEDDAEYDEDDLDDIPLKTLRGRKTSSAPSLAPSFGSIAPFKSKSLPQQVQQVQHVQHVQLKSKSLPQQVQQGQQGQQGQQEQQMKQMQHVQHVQLKSKSLPQQVQEVQQVQQVQQMKQVQQVQHVQQPLSQQQPQLQQQYPKGTVKAVKRQPTIQTKPKVKPKPRVERPWPISPASPPASRKPSLVSLAASSDKPRPSMSTATGVQMSSAIFSQQVATPTDDHKTHVPYFHDDNKLGIEEPSVKPRCQRCRKSKKGCDRQRPCQRCKDAGIPVDECISEDEAGTRRGRQAAAAAAKKAAVGAMAGLGKNKLTSTNPATNATNIMNKAKRKRV